MSKKGTLSPKKHKAIEALLLSGNVAQAAKAAGVARSTLNRWLADPDFTAALVQAETQAIEALARLMAGHATAAATVLVKVLYDPDASHSEKIKASRVFLSSLPTIRLLGSIERRLSELQGKE